MSFNTKNSWTILSAIEVDIKRKIESIGIPLKDWDIEIYRGILTGYNEAFIISGEKKDELIAADPKSAEIIRPILRGRDIKRYGYDFADLWLIATFPSKNYDIEDYPAVKEHFLSFGVERLEQTGKVHIVDGEKIKARKKTNNKWFETQDSISYWDEFSKQKLVWTPVNSVYRFALIPEDIYFNNSIFMITGESLEYLCGILNSNLYIWYFENSLSSGSYAYGSREFFSKIPIIRPSTEQHNIISSLVHEMSGCNGDDNKDCLREINKQIYSLFELTQEEVNYIETFNIT